MSVLIPQIRLSQRIFSRFRITGSADSSIKVWKFNPSYKDSFESPNEKIRTEDVIKYARVINHHKSSVTCLEYDGLECIISGNRQGYILIIDINGALRRVLYNVHCTEPITCLRLQGALIIASTNTGKIMFWNRRNNRCESILNCHECSINSITYFDQKFYTAGE